MAETEAPPKRVMFSEDTTVVDGDGQVTETNGTHGDKNSAESHAHSPELNASAGADKNIDEVTAMFEGLAKKKKKKPKKEGEDGEADADAAATGDGELDLSGLKKKKKKKSKPVETDDFEAELAKAGVEAGEKDDEDKPEETQTMAEGDMEKGTGIWAHEATETTPYPQLLSRFFTLLISAHPDLAGSGSKSYKIPPPQCLREGNKKTIFANISDICKRIKRTDEHMTQFLFAELGTSGSVDGSKRLVIKGRFQQKQIENVLRRYIVEYVTCKTCRSPNTELNKGENRLYFVTCNSCGSRRSVSAIKTGFSAQVGKRKRQA
ncbi:hypothetical protein K402DRAFT_390720 [Aulographum hederae CBS 113979]|uniref:Translation initiation factor IF2/IF5 domain-containing protein n=1 Tax=Aulographum hederae CBS 113979 TaxID=1176131 RepID=A0A6G1H9P9_9PEZI|nr:hypothetical protein K402DRAFT_390720 [Aulographum hederae CBS 113979]